MKKLKGKKKSAKSNLDREKNQKTNVAKKNKYKSALKFNRLYSCVTKVCKRNKLKRCNVSRAMINYKNKIIFKQSRRKSSKGDRNLAKLFK